jgi:hypothetical protein
MDNRQKVRDRDGRDRLPGRRFASGGFYRLSPLKSRQKSPANINARGALLFPLHKRPTNEFLEIRELLPIFVHTSMVRF